MKPDAERYKEVYRPHMPRSNFLKDGAVAFVVGGAICVLGQVFLNYYGSLDGVTKDAAALYTSLTLIALSALATGLGVYDKLSRHAGAGTLVPITGFANAVVSPALEFKSEGYVLGTGAKMFIIARPCIEGFAAYVGKKEKEGPLSDYFTDYDEDTMFGQSSWECAESELQKRAFERAKKAAGIVNKDLDLLFGGDLLNQCIASGYAARGAGIPFVGLRGARRGHPLRRAVRRVLDDGGIARARGAERRRRLCAARRGHHVQPFLRRRAPVPLSARIRRPARAGVAMDGVGRGLRGASPA